MKLYLIIFLIVLTKFAFGQSQPLNTHQIDSIAKAIDSIKNPYSIFEDGYIKRVHKGVINKVFGKHSTGGYSTDYFGNNKTKKLFKVAHYSTMDERNTFIYYYFDDDLILVVSSRTKKNSNKNISNGRFYFQQDQLVRQTGDDIKTKPTSIITTGKEYLKRWQENFAKD